MKIVKTTFKYIKQKQLAFLTILFLINMNVVLKSEPKLVLNFKDNTQKEIFAKDLKKIIIEDITSVNENYNLHNISINPNPINSLNPILNIEINSNNFDDKKIELTSINLLNINGQLIQNYDSKKLNINQSETNITNVSIKLSDFEGNELIKGIYFLKINFKDQFITKKIIVE